MIAVAPFEYWSRMSIWTANEATALLCGFDPDGLEDERMLLTHCRMTWRLVQRALDAGLLPESGTPSEFIRWARTCQLDVSDSLENLVKHSVDSSTDWKAEAEKYKGEAKRATEAFGYYQAQVAKRDSRISDLYTQLEALQQSASKATAGEKTSALQRSLNTVLRILGGIAIAVYSYNPHERRSDVVKQIQNDLDLKGVNVDEDTIRKWLKESARIATNASELKQ